MKETRNFHVGNVNDIKKNLADTQRKIEKIENQVKSGGENDKNGEYKSKTDVCGYKVFMKDKSTMQLDELRDHLVMLEEELEMKWLDLVAQISLKEKHGIKMKEAN